MLDQYTPTIETAEFAALTFCNLGLFVRSQGDYARAVGYFEASGLCSLGRTAFLLGQHQRAEDAFRRAFEVMRDTRLAGHALADCLDWLAAMPGADDRVRDAAVLFGAAHAQWQASGAVRYAPERAAYAAEVAGVQGQLDRGMFAAAWAEGRTISREQAGEFALSAPSTGDTAPLPQQRARATFVLRYVSVPPLTLMIHREDLTETNEAEQRREAMAQSENLRALVNSRAACSATQWRDSLASRRASRNGFRDIVAYAVQNLQHG